MRRPPDPHPRLTDQETIFMASNDAEMKEEYAASIIRSLKDGGA